jgi:hypothetical protein
VEGVIAQEAALDGSFMRRAVFSGADMRQSWIRYSQLQGSWFVEASCKEQLSPILALKGPISGAPTLKKPPSIVLILKVSTLKAHTSRVLTYGKRED